MPLPLIASRRLDLPPLTVAALEALIAGDRQALLVMGDDGPAGIVTRADLLEALAR